MRARYPDFEGFIERDGIKVGYDVFGEGEPTLVFSPLDAISSSRMWKAQVPYLARASKVVNVEPRGNGRSDRPNSALGYADAEFVADTIAVMDAANIAQAVLVGLCASGWFALLTAALHPDRVLGVVSISTWAPFLSARPARHPSGFADVLHTDEGWNEQHWEHWRADWQGYGRRFFSELLPELHSTKQHEDAVGWAMDGGYEAVRLCEDGPLSTSSAEQTEAIIQQVRCPVLAIHGRADRCQPWEFGARLADLTGGELLVLDGSGHLPQAREPVIVNRAIRDFADRLRPRPVHPVQRTWTRPAQPAEAGAVHVLAHRARSRPTRPGHRR